MMSGRGIYCLLAIVSVVSLFFLFSFMPSVSAVGPDVVDVTSNMYLDYVAGGICKNLSEVFIDFDYICLEFCYGDYCVGEDQSFCDSFVDGDYYMYFEEDGYFNISVGRPSGTPINETHYICINHDYDDTDLNFTNPFTIFPLEIQAWDIYGFMTSQYITVKGEGYNWSNLNLTTSPSGKDYIHPTMIRSVSDVPLTQGYGILSMNNYFTNYDYVVFSFTDSIFSNRSYEAVVSYNDAKFCLADSGPMPGYFGQATICFSGDDEDVYLRLYPNGYDTLFNVTVRAYNQYGYASDDFIFSTSNLTADVDDMYSYIESIDETPSDYSFVTYLTKLFNSLFPHYDTISMRSRFSYILVIALVVNLGGLFLFIDTGNSKFAGLVLLVLNCLMFFYFIAIRYMPASVLIVMLSLLIGIPLFKSKVIG